MANTTNYNWETPDDTDLVKDGAAAIRTLGSSIDTTTKNLNPETTLGDMSFRSATSNVNTRLPIGSSGQHLTVVAGVPAWATASDQTPLTTKGDLFTFSTVDARLGVGANNTVLTADSSEATGLKWAAPAGSSGPTFRAYRSGSDQSLTINTATKIQFNAEDWDTDSCFDSTTNYRFTANKAGYYQFNTSIAFDTTGAVGRNELWFYKNGSQNTKIADGPAPQSYGTFSGSVIINLNGTTDYVEVYLTLGAATDKFITNGTVKTSFTGVWIRS